ncbi:MAG: BlaI/MecI/CopY family transcriptional regulator [Planctomycetes bacterium]|nr:BlaI/MecI/CopY family transcriptional regulator [Planctomycetota bacterium]
MDPASQLTPLQLAVLRALWAHGEATVAEVREHLADQRELAQQTVATVLARLEKQGVVTHRNEGRQFVYRALLAERDAEQGMVGELAERVFAGDYGRLFQHLLGRDEVDADELAKVRALIDARLAQEDER